MTEIEQLQKQLSEANDRNAMLVEALEEASRKTAGAEVLIKEK